MPLRAWMFAVAIGLTAGLGQAQEEADRAEGEAAQQEEPAQALPLPFPVEFIEEQTAADARENREAEARQHEIDDLIAQQGMNAATQAMNRATQDMRDYAYVQTWFVAIGTVLLIVTLLLTLGANISARKAVKVTRDIGEKQVRAYLSFGDNLISYNANIGKVTISCPIFNSGQSPTRRLVAKFSIEIDSVDGGIIQMEPNLADVPDIPGGGGCEIAQGTFNQTCGFNKNFPDGIYNMFIKVDVTGQNVFGSTYSGFIKSYIDGRSILEVRTKANVGLEKKSVFHPQYEDENEK